MLARPRRPESGIVLCRGEVAVTSLQPLVLSRSTTTAGPTARPIFAPRSSPEQSALGPGLLPLRISLPTMALVSCLDGCGSLLPIALR